MFYFPNYNAIKTTLYFLTISLILYRFVDSRLVLLHRRRLFVCKYNYCRHLGEGQGDGGRKKTELSSRSSEASYN